MYEVRDIGPVDAIVVGERDGRPQAVSLHPHPNITQFIDCQLAAPAPVVDRRFKLVKSDLPDHRVSMSSTLPAMRTRRRTASVSPIRRS